RQQHHLPHRRQPAQAFQRRGQGVVGERHPFAQLHWRGLVVDADCKERHVPCAKLWRRQGRHFTARPPRMPAMPVSRILAFLLALAAAPALGASRDAAIPARNDLLEATIAGEFALQAGKLDEAAKWYLQAATAADGDAGLARRAASIALLSGDETGAAAALRLWRERDPASLVLHSAEMVLALRTADEATARARLARQMDAAGPEGCARQQ